MRLVTASARTLPERMWASCGGRLSNIICVSLASIAACAGPLPRNGMCTTNVPVIALKSSEDICGEVP